MGGERVSDVLRRGGEGEGREGRGAKHGVKREERDVWGVLCSLSKQNGREGLFGLWFDSFLS